jgi:hypothetical protein
MALIPLRPFKTPRRAAASQVSQLFNVPPPVGGLNYRDPISEMSPKDALVLDNFIPRQQGVEIRHGWRYQTSAIEGPINSIFAYNAATPANSKIFAASGGVIYDVTSSTPTVAVAATGSSSGIWWTTQFSTQAGTFLLAVSPNAGYWTYDNVNGWVNRTSATVGLPTSVRTVAVWKNRIWFTVDNGPTVYYMRDVNAIQGNADPFPMGAVLRNGGHVSALINWTLDSGFSLDDYLVVVGSQGDIGVWVGTDPTTVDTFGLKGVWYVGPVPRYGVFFTPYGGDVMLLSAQGLVQLSQLVSGQYNDAANQNLPSAKIQTVLTPEVALLIDDQTWDVFLVPYENVLVIKLPPDANGNFKQYGMSTVTGAWCTFSSIPMSCVTMLNGQVYFGTSNGRVARAFYGQKDAVETNGTGGNYVQADVQSSFNNFGTPANLKKFSMARPIFISSEAPSVKLQLNVQYGFEGVAGSPSFSGTGASLWDSGLWNQAVWSGSVNTYQAWVGVSGLGYYGSLRMKVRGLAGTVYTSSHVMSEPGGVM